MDQSSVASNPRSVVGNKFRVVRRRWRLVALVAVLAVAASLAYSLLRLPEYRSTAEVLLSATAYDVQRGGAELTPEEMATQVRVATSRPVAALVRDDLRLTTTPSLSDLVTVEALGTSRVLRFTARTSHPDEAAEVARSVATSYLLYRQTRTQQTLTEVTAALTDRQARMEAALDRLDAAIATGPDPGGQLAAKRRTLEAQYAQIATQVANLDIAVTGGAGGELLTQPEESTSQVAPRPLLNATLSLLIGLLAGVALVLTLDHFDDVAHDEESLLAALDPVPVLARVPRWRATEPDDQLVTVTRPDSRSSQAFQELVARLRYVTDKMPGTVGLGVVLVCTSAEADEGKTDVAANVAVAAARAGMRVILVDADLRRRPEDGLVGVPDGVSGLSDALAAGIEVEKLLLKGPVRRLFILPAGTIPSDPAGLMVATSLEPIFDSLVQQADLVIVDAAPNARYADSLEVAGIADVTLLVTRLGRSHLSAVRAAAGRLRDVGAANLGVVVLGGPVKGERRSARAVKQGSTGSESTGSASSAPASTAPGSTAVGPTEELEEPQVQEPDDLRVRQSPRS